VLDEVDAVDDVGVPCYLGEVEEEAEELDEEADADGLREVLVYGVSSVVICYAYRYSQKDSDHYACQHGQCCLLVMLAGEQAWILECSQGANYGELGAPENGIGLEMAHFAMCMCVVEGCPELGTTSLVSLAFTSLVGNDVLRAYLWFRGRRFRAIKGLGIGIWKIR
jgi:hypothetical protein